LGPRKVAHSALYLAIAIVLPIGFHQFGLGGRIFSPMHIPVLICGFTVGPMPAVLVGLMAPVLSHLLTGMPPTYAVPLMTMELAMYGLSVGMVYKWMKIKNEILRIYIALILAMIVGRLVFAFGLFALGLFIEMPYGPAQFFAIGGAVMTGLPGIAVQLVIIPPLVAVIKRTTRPV
jgi:riboflavin transporter FmnP